MAVLHCGATTDTLCLRPARHAAATVLLLLEAADASCLPGVSQLLNAAECIRGCIAAAAANPGNVYNAACPFCACRTSTADRSQQLNQVNCNLPADRMQK
jgi:hypothetical protein